MTTPLDAEQAAALNAPHVVHAVDANGAYLGLVAAAAAAAVATCAPPAVGTWQWLAGGWVRVLSLADAKAARIANVQLAIEAEERAQARPLRELMAAQLAETTPPAEAAAQLEAVDAAVTALRAIRSAMDAATTLAELAAVVWPA